MTLDAISAKLLSGIIRQVIEGREAVGYDLRHPVGFSQYLYAAYGQNRVPRIGDLIMEAFKVTNGKGSWKDRYSVIFKSFIRAMAPHGMCVARGMHSIGFLPGEDIERLVMPMYSESSYSENIVVASWLFSTRFLHPKMLSHARLTPSWARAARDLIQRGHSNQEAVRLSQSPVVLVSHVTLADLYSWGGDSESGETHEAELKIKNCEPRCLRHIFVASTRPLGRAVREDERRYYGLDSHIEHSYTDSYGSRQPLYLHPDTKAKGKTVKHLPPGWTWYEVKR